MGLKIQNIDCIFSRDTGSKICLGKKIPMNKKSELKDATSKLLSRNHSGDINDILKRRLKLSFPFLFMQMFRRSKCITRSSCVLSKILITIYKQNICAICLEKVCHNMMSI